MTAAFNSVLGALFAVYEQEIERLADKYEHRIRSGEFSGYDAALETVEGRCGLRWMLLDNELQAHPWANDRHTGRAVLAVSPWAYDERNGIDGGGAEVGLELDTGLRAEVSECLARDVMSLAIKRGWLKRGSRGNGGEPQPARRVKAA